MLRLISWFLMIPVAAAVILLSVANREDITVSLAPLPVAAFVLPLPVVVLAAVGVGFLWGALVAWISAARSRRLAGRYRYRAEQAEGEAKRLADKIAKMETTSAAFGKSPTEITSKITSKIPAKILPPPGSADAA